MSLIALIFALSLSYYLPRSHPEKLKNIFLSAAHRLARPQSFKARFLENDILAWLLTALLPAIVIGVAFYFCNHFLPVLGLLLNVIVLYFTLTFDGVFNKPTQIVDALRDNHNALANSLYREWVPNDAETVSDLSNTAIARKSIEVSLQRGHYQWFAPIFWFIIFSAIGLGAAGAVLYRLTDILAHDTPITPQPSNPNQPSENLTEAVTTQASVSSQLFAWFDTPPAHLTGWGFAIMGDFEDALYCWREQATTWSDGTMNHHLAQNKGILLTAGAGALGVKLGGCVDDENLLNSATQNATQPSRPEIGLGDDADADYLHSAIGLVWRVLILMLSLLLLFTFAYWLGN